MQIELKFWRLIDKSLPFQTLNYWNYLVKVYFYLISNSRPIPARVSGVLRRYNSTVFSRLIRSDETHAEHGTLSILIYRGAFFNSIARFVRRVEQILYTIYWHGKFIRKLCCKRGRKYLPTSSPVGARRLRFDAVAPVAVLIGDGEKFLKQKNPWILLGARARVMASREKLIALASVHVEILLPRRKNRTTLSIFFRGNYPTHPVEIFHRHLTVFSQITGIFPGWKQSILFNWYTFGTRCCTSKLVFDVETIVLIFIILNKQIEKILISN